MLQIKNKSVLNSIQASGADAVKSNGIVTITGLPPFRAAWCQGYQYTASAAGTAQVNRVEFGSATAGAPVVIYVTYLDSVTNYPTVATWNYTVGSASGYAATAQAAFKTWLDSVIAGNGYTTSSASTYIQITAPKNTILATAVSTAYSGGITSSITTAAVAQTGYGDTLQDVYVIPTASSTTANDGIVATYYYGMWVLPLIYEDQGGNFIQDEYILFAYASEADYADLVTAMTNLSLS